MQEFPPDWTTLDKIDFLQRKILLNSVAYYRYDINFLSDYFYDGMCKQLVKLQSDYEKRGGSIKKDSRFGYVYYDFDGSTGFHLYPRLSDDDMTEIDYISYMFCERGD